MSLDAMKQALTALERGETQLRYEAITALRAAIEQAEKPRQWQGLTEDEIKRRVTVNPIRVRIMQEAYDLADRDDIEGYNSVKVMCSEVLRMINELLDERQWHGLTEEEVSEILDREIGFNSCFGPETDFARAIEAKLREKNT